MRTHFFSRYFSPSTSANRRHLMWVGLLCTGLLSTALFATACADAQGPLDPDDFYGQAQPTEVLEPIEFTDQNYDFHGETTIADLQALITAGRQRFWYGFSPQDPYPDGDNRQFGKNCHPFQDPAYPEPVQEVAELPTFIEGVITLHPRFFQKITVCGQDQRYYGAFFIQDDTGGIMVLKDTRIADFSFGDRVRLRVRGLMKSYDTYAVLTYDSEEVVEPNYPGGIYYETAERSLGYADIGMVRRVRGTIVGEPTNTNFNEMLLRDDNGIEYAASVDRELAQRNIELKEGMRVELTGPVINSYGSFVVLVASKGQIKWLDK